MEKFCFCWRSWVFFGKVLKQSCSSGESRYRAIQVPRSRSPSWKEWRGVIAGVLVVFALFKGFSRVPLKLFFRLTSVLLILMAAGMIASGVGRLISIGVLSPLVFQVWDTSRLLNEHSLMGTLFSDFFGYRARPSLMTLITVWGYLAVMFTGMWRLSQIRTAPSSGTLPDTNKTPRPTGHPERH